MLNIYIYIYKYVYIEYTWRIMENSHMNPETNQTSMMETYLEIPIFQGVKIGLLEGNQQHVNQI